MDKPVIENAALLAAAREGLTRNPKTMEPKWFYDEAGSELFEDITVLPEYYPTRTEVAILRDNLDTLGGHVPDGAELVELGSGASTKTRLLLDRFDALSRYVPLDVSADFLNATAEVLKRDYPALDVRPVVGDFTAPMRLPPTDAPRVVFFPGSTIGNLTRAEARDLLRGVRDWPGVHAFILGVDLVKDPEVMEAAYDDDAGVTAAFNLNLLHRMNREIAADFDVDRFAHRALWNADAARIEMHLVSLTDQTVRIGDTEVTLAEAETIHTESSHKFTPKSLRDLSDSAGWRVGDLLTDAGDNFAVAVLLPN